MFKLNNCNNCPLPEETACEETYNCNNPNSLKLYLNGAVFDGLGNYIGKVTKTNDESVTIVKKPYELVLGFDKEGLPVVKDFTDDPNSIPKPFHTTDIERVVFLESKEFVDKLLSTIEAYHKSKK